MLNELSSCSCGSHWEEAGHVPVPPKNSSVQVCDDVWGSRCTFSCMTPILSISSYMCVLCRHVVCPCEFSLCWTWRVIAAFVDCAGRWWAIWWRQVREKDGAALGTDECFVAEEGMNATLHQPHMDKQQAQGQSEGREDGRWETEIETKAALSYSKLSDYWCRGYALSNNDNYQL